jgi:flagellar hook-length control protein FliK
MEKSTVSGHQTKSEVLSEFMDSMESEFGVRPERLLRTLASLSKEELLAPATESSNSIIKNLELTPNQQEAAMILYGDMVSKVNAINASQMDFTGDNDHTSSLSAQRNNLAAVLGQLRKTDIDRGVSEMGQQFFNSDPSKAMAVARLNSQSNTAAVSAVNSVAEHQSLDGTEFVAGTGLSGALRVPTDLSTSNSAARDNFNLINELSNTDAGELNRMSSQTLPAISKEDLFGQMMQEATPDGESSFDKDLQLAVDGLSLSTLVPDSIVPEIGTHRTQGEATGLALAGHAEGGSDSNDMNLDSSDAGGDDVDSDSLRGLFGNLAGNEAQRIEEPFFIAPTEGATTASVENVDKIIEESQLLLKDGGGEMKMKLKPEGLGEVGLRVSVEGGKVSVQLTASSPEVQRHLEASLSDLKLGLEMHKLQVDQIRVDVSNHANGDLGRSPDQSESRMAQQQFAREFLQDFRDSNRSRQDGFFETTGLRGYKQARRIDPQPIEPNNTNDRRSHESKGLYLVA